MKTWYKYSLNYDNGKKFLPKDETFDDHKKSMQGYDSSKGYCSKEQFFKVYFYDGHSRHRDYHDYLKKNLKKGDEILSIGSGRCVNELLLTEEGFNITCSDLEQPCQRETMWLFPHLKFVKYDVTKAPSDHKFDSIVSLSMFYLFDEKQLFEVFKNIADGLKHGGIFVFDPGGAEDNLLTKLIDDVLCPFEAYLRVISHKVLKRENCIVTKKHQGYRAANDEIVSMANKAGFRLCDIKTDDYVTELRRIRFFELLPEKFVGLFGRSAPYVRIFNFKKNG
jgi:SAM-dependent methyltransferase